MFKIPLLFVFWLSIVRKILRIPPTRTGRNESRVGSFQIMLFYIHSCWHHRLNERQSIEPVLTTYFALREYNEFTFALQQLWLPRGQHILLSCVFVLFVLFWPPYLTGPLKAVYDPNTARLGWEAHLIPFLVLDNTPKCKKSQSTHFLTTSTYIQRKSFAVPSADWARISIRPGNNMSQEAAHHSLQCNTVFFSQVNLIWFSNHF